MAIDPLTAKLLAQAAARAATDEESRRRLLILILAPILGLLLLIAFILYLITSPFSVLSQCWQAMRWVLCRTFKSNTAITSSSAFTKKDYIEGSGQSYEGVILPMAAGRSSTTINWMSGGQIPCTAPPARLARPGAAPRRWRLSHLP